MVVGEDAVGVAATGAGEWAVELVEHEEGAVELGGNEEEGEGKAVDGILDLRGSVNVCEYDILANGSKRRCSAVRCPTNRLPDLVCLSKLA